MNPAVDAFIANYDSKLRASNEDDTARVLSAADYDPSVQSKKFALRESAGDKP
jgi:hypothetical protein